MLYMCRLSKFSRGWIIAILLVLYSVFSEHFDAWSLCNELSEVIAALCFACADFLNFLAVGSLQYYQCFTVFSEHLHGPFCNQLGKVSAAPCFACADFLNFLVVGSLQYY
jgi:hypothetical protein